MKSPKEKITLSNGQEFIKISIPTTSKDTTDEELRLYIPDWNKLIKSLDFYAPFEKRNPNHKFFSSTYLPLLMEYYQYHTLLPVKVKRKNHPYNKFYRKFNMDSLLYLPDFNKKIVDLKLEAKRIFKYLKDLNDKEKKVNKDKIRGDLLKAFLPSEEETISDLISEAFYDKIEKPQPFSLIGYLQFINIELEKVKKIINHFSSKEYNPEFCTESDYEVIKKYLKDDELIEGLCKDSVIEEKTELANNLLKEVEWTENIESGNPILKSDEKKLISTGLDKKALNIMNEIITRLKEIKKNQKKDEKKQRIKKIIKNIKVHIDFPIKYRWVGLVHIKNQFADKKVARKYLLKELEEHFQYCLREQAKKALILLEKEEKLSEPEVILYTMHNIGIKKLNYLTPLLTTPLYSFFNYCKNGMGIFIEVVLKRNPQLPGGFKDWELYLDLQFKSYLKFYKIYIEIVRAFERERISLKDKQREKTDVSQNMYIDNTGVFEDVHNEDIESDNKAITTDMKVKEGAENDNSHPKDEYNNYSEDEDDKYYRKNKSNYSEILSVTDKKYESFHLYNFLDKVLSNDELELFNKLIIDKDDESEVAKEYKVSRQAINKRKKKILKKIQGHPEFKDFLPYQR